jgi:hypothetical protein
MGTGYVEGMGVSAGHAYICTYYEGLHVIDITEPQDPRVVSTLPLICLPMNMSVAGSCAYVGGWVPGSPQTRDVMDVIDVSNPEAPVLLGTLELGSNPPYDLAVSGSYALIITNGSVLVADVSDAGNLQVVGSVPIGIVGCNGVTISGNYAYATGDGVEVIDISDLPNARVIGCAGLMPDPPRNTAVAGGLCYVACGMAGLQILPAQCDFSTGVTYGNGFSRGLNLSVQPNPVSGPMAIRFDQRNGGFVRASVYDLAGRLVRDLQRGIMSAGLGDLLWDGRDGEGNGVAPGVYLVRVSTSRGTDVARVVVLK